MFERTECAGNETERREDNPDRRSDDSRQAREVNAGSVTKWCDYCSGPVATDEWYPAATRHDEDGDVKIFGFCDDECRMRWESEDSGE